MKHLSRKTAAYTAIEPLEARIAPARYVWQVGDGNWTTPSNWFNATTGSTATDFPDDIGDLAIFEDTPHNVTLNTTVTVGVLASQFDAVTQINGPGAIRFDNSSAAPVIGAVNGSMQIYVAVRIVSAAGLNVDARAQGNIEIGGVILNPGAINGPLTKTGVGTATFSGSAANTYVGETTVQEGTLVLSKSNGVNAVTGNVTVSDGATLRTLANEQIPNTATITFGSTSTLKVGGDETVAGLSGTGGLLDLGGKTLTLASDFTFTGGFRGSGTFDLIDSTLTLAGNDATAGNTITLPSGSTVISGSYPGTNFVGGGGFSTGTGTVGTFTADGELSPGAGGVAGSFSVQSIGVVNAGLIATFDLNGKTPGTGYDQIVVRPGGTVNLGADLGDLSLNPGSGFRPQAFTLIDNQGSQPVSGNWTNLPEGSVIPVNGIDFTLTYQGGDGNDVVLSPGGPDATVSADGKTATYTDLDGDRVTIKSSKGGLTTDRIVLSKANALGGSSLLLLDATVSAFAGTSLTITAKPVPNAGVAGDGLANVRVIDAGTNALGSVKIGGDLAEIDAGAVKNLSVATFGLVDQSQPASTLASLGKFSVKGDVDTARLIITGALGSAKIGGSVNRAVLFDIGTQVGTFSVRGDFTRSELTIGGTDNPTAKQAIVLKSLTIGGDVTGSIFRIGHDYTTSIGSDPNRKNADVQVGKVVVKGNWTGSNFYVGTDAGPDKRFGTADDLAIPGGNGTVAKIGSFTIGGLAAGDTGLRSFGIVAEQIGALKIGKAKAALSKTAPDALPLLLTGDFFAREIGAPDPVLAALPNANAHVGPAVIELSALTELKGFQINGEAAGDNSGRSVSAAGDVNGDGFDDIIIGAHKASPNGAFSGASYVVFGRRGGITANLELSTLDGSDGFQINGEAAGDQSGRSVSAAGDVNGDGFDDIIIGANGADPNGSSSGASYVVFGRAGGFAANLNLSTLDGSNGFQINGAAANDLSGRSVSAAGDVNGDGFDDLLIGAYSADPNGSESGASYVVFGQADGFGANLELSTLDGSNGFQINGEAAGDTSGFSVSAAGDVNGDGFDDLLIGAYKADPNGTSSGASYVVFGKAGGFAANLNLSTLDGSNGFQINGEAAFDGSGRSVSGAGDVNGDGFDDLLIGAHKASPNGTYSGASYVVFGKAGGFAANLELSTLDGSNGFQINGEAAGDFAGYSVSGAGDVNGDGFDDLLIGASLADPNGSASGASYVVFGKAVGFAANLELSTLNGSNGFQINGEAESDFSGTSVSAAGDVNGDGFDDILIGADGADPNGSYSGSSYVVFGRGNGVAMVSADGKTATWLDVDGDLVTLKSSKGGLTADRLHLSTPNALGGSRLVSADFTDAAFAGSNITITAKTQKGLPTADDGLVHVGSIFAGANALGTVSIAGDLAQLDAGAVKSLTVNSLGLFPVATKGAPGTSEVASLGALTVKTSWQSVDLTVTGALGKATIGGTVRDATLAATAVGPVKIGGDLIDAKLLIAGVASPTAKTALALKSLAIGGSLKTSDILLGYDATGAPVNAQVQAGKIAIKGNFIASNLIAGTTAGADDLFGTADDAVIPGASAIISRIASITIGGSAFGTSAADDHFGIVAQQIAALKVGKAKAALSKTGTDVLEFLITGDSTARELA